MLGEIAFPEISSQYIVLGSSNHFKGSKNNDEHQNSEALDRN